MKRSVFVLATLVGAMGAAHAQSNVTVFGVVDLAINSMSASGVASKTLMVPDANTSSRWGMRGTEDLGGGLKASFHLEGALDATNGGSGTASTNNVAGATSSLFGRRSTVSLSSTWGELRAGRDYVPSFGNLTVSSHPFGTNGLANAGQLFYPVAAGGTSARTNVRASNSIGYFLPATLGGIYGQVMYAYGDATSTADAGKHVGGRIGYKAGPLDMSLASGTTTYVTGDYTQSNFAINYKFGPAKLMYLWGQNKVGVTSTTANMIGTQYALGAGELRASYTRLTADRVANDANQLGLGYVHPLSKRTAVYTNYSVVKNENGGKAFGVGDGDKPVEAGGSSSGFQIGLRHSF